MPALWILKKPVYKFATYHTASRVLKFCHTDLFSRLSFSLLIRVLRCPKCFSFLFQQRYFYNTKYGFLCYRPSWELALGADSVRRENVVKQSVKGSGLTYTHIHVLVYVKLAQHF